MLANMAFIEPRPRSEAEVFETLEHLYYDVALSAHPVPFAALRRIAPISQIVFGSDWPFAPECHGAPFKSRKLLNGDSL